MLPGERFKNWIDGLALEWKDRLRGWMGSWLGFGIDVFFDKLGKSAAPKLKPIIDKLERETTIPPELKPLFDELKEPSGEFAAILGNAAGGALLGGALGRIVDYILRPLTYGLSFAIGFFIHDAPILISLWRRGEISETYLNDHLRWHGMGSDDIEQLKKVTEFLPDAMTLVNWQAREVFEETMIDRYGLDSDFVETRPPFIRNYHTGVVHVV
ncbi:hypothetical protein LCGC14_2968310 [marine sediment metagenome]|uniref:Uncharacterized protein n=1 Tax=marine sediment metagenome TaxID=412755 RepID=A0A0F8ZHX0_9ZZZZ